MARKKLREVIALEADGDGSLRWRAAVPLVTNPLLAVEAFQFAFAGAAVVLVTLCLGLWVTDGALMPEDAATALAVSGLVFLAILGGLVFVSVVFFGNRYFAVYRADSSGMYHEGSRGRDGRKGLFTHWKAMPVAGAVEAARTHGRFMPWEKADRFHDLPAMRAIVLKRGFWHILRLYTPDADTHERVARYLEGRLKKV